MDINFESYKIFYHTARSCSFSEAAKSLFISQSAVSQAIKNLEKKLGVMLFYRKTRNIKLTQEGELLLKHIEQAYNFIKAAENKLAEMQNLESGEIRIGVGDTICKHYLIPYLERFNQKYPRVKIQVINRTSAQILQILKNGLIDLGIVTLPVCDDKISVDELIELEDIFVASDRYSSLKGKNISLSELSSYPLLMLKKGSSTRRNLDNFLLGRGIGLIPEIELESIDLLVEFARIGLGIAHVLKESALKLIQDGELFQINLKEQLPMRKLGIATINDVPLCRAAHEFIGLLKG